MSGYQRIAVVGVMAAVGIQIVAAGTAAAADFKLQLFGWGNPQGCQVTDVSCDVIANLTDTTTPVTFSVNGTVLGTFTAAKVATETDVYWTPHTPGQYVVSATQGATTHSVTVNIIDRNSPQAILGSMSASISNSFTSSLSGSNGVVG